MCISHLECLDDKFLKICSIQSKLNSWDNITHNETYEFACRLQNLVFKNSDYLENCKLDNNFDLEIDQTAKFITITLNHLFTLYTK